MTENDTLDAPKTETNAGWYSNDAATFGDRVAGAREAVGLSQGDLARKLGVKQRTIEHWEDDITEPRAARLNVLAGVLNVSLMWLLNGEGEGISEPDEAVTGRADFADLLTEIRQVRGTMTLAADKLGKLEKRLRRALGDAAL